MDISHKKITGIGLQPNPQQLEIGEIAINVDDGSVFTKLLSGNIVKVNISAESVTNSILSEEYWDISIKGDVSNPTVFYDTKRTYGRYYRIGSLVYIYGQLVLTSTSGGSGYVYVGGLPFAPTYPSSLSIANAVQWNLASPGYAQILVNSRIVFRRATVVGGIATSPLLTCSNLSNTTQLYFSGFYHTNDNGDN